jgi:hypothetical protein
MEKLEKNGEFWTFLGWVPDKKVLGSALRSERNFLVKVAEGNTTEAERIRGLENWRIDKCRKIV